MTLSPSIETRSSFSCLENCFPKSETIPVYTLTLHSKLNCNITLHFFWLVSPQWARASSFTRFLDQTQRRNTVGGTPLDEWSARRRDLYLTTHDTHNKQTNIHAPGGIRNHNPSKRAASDLRLRPRGHWDRHYTPIYAWIFKMNPTKSLYPYHFSQCSCPATQTMFPLFDLIPNNICRRV